LFEDSFDFLPLKVTNEWMLNTELKIYSVARRRARKETDRLCSDNEAGGRDGKAER
jgi:hypothetical protein